MKEIAIAIVLAALSLGYCFISKPVLMDGYSGIWRLEHGKISFCGFDKDQGKVWCRGE